MDLNNNLSFENYLALKRSGRLSELALHKTHVHQSMCRYALIDNLNLKKGSYILDAGAGLGPLQYILAARGYNIASLDFKKRKSPSKS